MENKKKSLEKWLTGLIIGGACMMSLVIVIISMVLYMRSVRRIYKAEMLKSADSVLKLAGYENIQKICLNSIEGKENDEEAIGLVKRALVQVYGDAQLTDLTLYSFDNTQMNGHMIATSVPQGRVVHDEISFSKRELKILLEGEATRKLEKDSENVMNSVIYRAIEDESGNIIGLLKVGMKIRETFDARIRFFLNYAPAFLVLMGIFSAFTMYAVRKRITVPLLALNAAAQNYGRRDVMIIDEEDTCSFELPDDLNEDEIGLLWKTCFGMESSIKNSIKILKSVTSEKERQAAEIEVASQIQLGMLPASDLEIDDNRNFSLAGSMNAAKGVGGDFYDYFMTDEGQLAIVIGDVSGKGIPASLFMVLSMTQIRMQTKNGRGPAEILKAANIGICANNPEMMFVTVWMGILDFATGIMRECNAGHEDPAIACAEGSYELDIREHDVPLGLMEDVELSEYTRTFHKGDRLFVYSDGVPEAMDPEDAHFSTDRLLKSLNEDRNKTDGEILEGMKTSITAFVKDAPQFDDITMVSFTYEGE